MPRGISGDNPFASDGDTITLAEVHVHSVRNLQRFAGMSRPARSSATIPTGSSSWGTAAITHMLDGKQHVLIPAGTTLTSFALPDEAVPPSGR